MSWQDVQHYYNGNQYVSELDGEWVDCWQCSGEAWFHNCGEDSCCCLEPEPGTACSECKGNGGWHVAPEPPAGQEGKDG